MFDNRLRFAGMNNSTLIQNFIQACLSFPGEVMVIGPGRAALWSLPPQDHAAFEDTAAQVVERLTERGISVINPWKRLQYLEKRDAWHFSKNDTACLTLAAICSSALWFLSQAFALKGTFRVADERRRRAASQRVP